MHSKPWIRIVAIVICVIMVITSALIVVFTL